MNVQLHRQMHPFYETMMLLAHTGDLAETRKETVDALSGMGLDGDSFYRSRMTIYEKYLKAFLSYRQPEPENAFWLKIEGVELSIALFGLLWSFREKRSGKKKATEIQSVLAEILSERGLKIDGAMIRSGRPDTLMAAISQTDLCSEDRWILLQILLNPEDSVSRMLRWIDLNIDAWQKAFAEIEPEYNELLEKYIPFIEKKNNPFRSMIAGLNTVSEIYPSLASPLSQFAFDETAFCGMLMYALDYPESEEAEPAEFLRVGWKALADKSKMEILRLLKTKPMYNQELAETLGLTAATVSYHMNALLACQFVTISKAEGRVYYHLNAVTLTSLLNQTKDLLVD